MTTTILRLWTALAPKLVAFLATGLTASGLLLALQLVGLQISPTLAALIVGGISSTAAFIRRDRLLELAPGQLSLKVIAFIVTSASTATVLSVLAEFGVDLSGNAPLITALLSVAAALVGYFPADRVPVDRGAYSPGVSITDLTD